MNLKLIKCLNYQKNLSLRKLLIAVIVFCQGSWKYLFKVRDKWQRHVDKKRGGL
jgi:hypothetical protein